MDRSESLFECKTRNAQDLNFVVDEIVFCHGIIEHICAVGLGHITEQ